MKEIKNLTFVPALVRICNRRGITARAVMLASFGVAAVLTLLVTKTLATPSSGIVSATVLARASFTVPVDAKFKIGGDHEEVIHLPDLQETVIQQVIVGPGGSTGWHSHPGPVIVLIKSGALAYYDSEDPTCTPRVYTAGEAFIDPGQGHVHLARNPSSTENAEVWGIYLDVPAGGAFRLDAADPGNCSF